MMMGYTTRVNTLVPQRRCFCIVRVRAGCMGIASLDLGKAAPNPTVFLSLSRPDPTPYTSTNVPYHVLRRKRVIAFERQNSERFCSSQSKENSSSCGHVLDVSPHSNTYSRPSPCRRVQALGLAILSQYLQACPLCLLPSSPSCQYGYRQRITGSHSCSDMSFVSLSWSQYTRQRPGLALPPSKSLSGSTRSEMCMRYVRPPFPIQTSPHMRGCARLPARPIHVAMLTPLTPIGLYNLHLLPAAPQFHRWRALSHHHDARSEASPPSVAPQLLSSEDRHLRPSHLSRDQAGHTTIHLGQTAIGGGDGSHEGNGYVPGRLYWPELGLLLEWLDL